MNDLKKILGTFLMVMAIAVVGQEVTPKDAAALREARTLRKKDPTAAKALLEKRVADKPADVHLFELGLWYAEDGDEDRAAATYRTLIKKTPTYPGAMRNLGIVLLRKSRYDEATKVLSELSRREPLGAELHRSLAGAYSSLGNHTAALAAFRNAVIGYPNDDLLQLRIAQTLCELRSVDEAEAVAREVLRRSPDTADAWLVIGNCNAAQEKYDKAVDALEAARRLSDKPSNELILALGDLYVALEMPKTAWKHYSAVPGAAGERLVALGRQFIEDGDLKQALAIVDGLKKRPDSAANTNLLLGLCELKRNRYPEAEAALKSALKTDPVNGEILSSLGDVAVKRKKIADAISWYRAARSSADWKRYAMEAELDLHLASRDYAKARLVLADLDADFPSPDWERLRRELSSH